MRVFLFLQLIALVIFIYIMYMLPSNLYFISITSIFIIVNTVGLTYYAFRMWGKELKRSNKVTKIAYFLLMFVALMAISLLFSNLFKMWLQRYPDDSLSNFANSLLVISTFLLVSFGISYIALKRELERQIKEYEKLKESQLRLKMQVIRYKTNPHFLFNSLSVAISMLELEEDKEKVARYLSDLAELFRAVLNTPETWTLEEELTLISRYLEIQKVRMQRFDYEILLSPECSKVIVPSLLLQPIVENSIVHGIAKSKNGGKITIKCSFDGRKFEIKVKDDGKGAEKIVPGMGLRLVEELMKAFFKESTVKYETSYNDGTTVILSWSV
ncbi:sensor histidine kinase [Fervidobacterium sp.]